MFTSASSWAHVTLYYSAYFAARALLGMFGGLIEKDAVVDVHKSQIGNQELYINRNPQSTYHGPHRRFWDLFYGAVPPLLTWIPVGLRYAIEPVQGAITWLIDNRNTVNYDTYSAHELAVEFQKSFVATKFPQSLVGPLSTQYAVAEGLLTVVSTFVRQFQLRTDALDSLTPAGPRRVKIERLVYRARPPKITAKARLRPGMF